MGGTAGPGCGVGEPNGFGSEPGAHGLYISCGSETIKPGLSRCSWYDFSPCFTMFQDRIRFLIGKRMGNGFRLNLFLLLGGLGVNSSIGLA